MVTRLVPIERPRHPVLRGVYWLSVWYFGKVLVPLKVFYARKMRLLWISSHISYTLEYGLSLDRALRFLVQIQTARLNGCTFCEDLMLAAAIRHKLGRERFLGLADYRTSACFTDRERTALRLAEECTTMRRVSEETWTLLRRYFRETEIIELVWVTAAENYFNLQATAFGFESERLAVSTTMPG